MVLTRSQNSTKSSLHAAARTLISLRTATAPAAAPAAAPVATNTQPYSRYMNLWSEWYHTFLSEATDENPSYPIADRRSQATSRWVTFASRQFRCSESEVRAWLRKADQKALLAASV